MGKNITESWFDIKVRKKAKTGSQVLKGFWWRGKAKIEVYPDGSFVAEVVEVPDVDPRDVYSALRAEVRELLKGINFRFLSNYNRGNWPSSEKWLCVGGRLNLTEEKKVFSYRLN